MSSSVSFSFPFEPYDIQKAFMQQLYDCLESGKLGIFESPTGTGKSLSLCCGAIQWLNDHNAKEKASLADEIEKLKISIKDDCEDDDWVSGEYNKIQKNLQITTFQKKLDKFNSRTEKIEKLRQRKNVKQLNKNSAKYNWSSQKDIEKFKKDTSKTDVEDTNEDLGAVDIIEDSDLILDEVIPSEFDEEDELIDEQDNQDSVTKIFFCSRTHSQLSQFVNEIKKTSYHSNISVISLASRQQYCINPSVQRLKSQHLINEQCLDLQKGKNGKATSRADDGKVTKRSKKSSGCPYYNHTNIEHLKDESLIEIKDVEDLVVAGKEVKTCPYYSARAAVTDAQIIVVPYQTLLHESTRKANGIDLKNNIVIIDEAHNLLDTIGHIHSAEVCGVQLKTAVDKLKLYRDKYKSRFAAKNLLQLNQVIYIVGKLFGLLKMTTDNPPSKIFTLEEFVLTAEIDNYNLRPLIDFCLKSKLAQKLHGFSEKYGSQISEETLKTDTKKAGLQDFLNQISKSGSKSNKNKPEMPAVDAEKELIEKETRISVGNAIQTVINFLTSLTSKYDDGRILLVKTKSVEDSFYKFLLLNPAVQFSNIVKESRSVIVAGGTMQPFSEFRDQLFISAGAAFERIAEFSCGHVIPPENILPICLSEGPSGKKLNFTYEMRNTPEMLNEIGRILMNICNIVPGGVVCFFPSYDYEKLVYNHLQSNKILDKIQIKKKIFREPKSSTNVDQILDEYSKTIRRCKNKELNQSKITGALMLSVVGGKLSEGLNFSDDLGRCVLVVGMPYPNIKSAELQEKMKYLKENVSTTAGQVHYENLCLKAVNQCIGRAVRHAKDYATVILLDERYSRENVQSSLPKWIQRSLVPNAKFGSAFGSIGKFFSMHKKSQ
ncbi:ATP-dependent DNA helicase DDX11 [Arctopsyche grandis]|uniref:ATP-dependent DNA helicase DDX11 n=1 Tax=Arctopsyche grandis TaxID=121162 RepID=UPI00406D91A1